MTYNLANFIEKYQLALEAGLQKYHQYGVCGLETEWNMLDSHLRPLLTVGSGPDQQSFVDYLRDRYIPAPLHGFSQLEIYHWMIEWTSQPYYTPRGAIYETRLQEAALINALHQIGRQFDERLYSWHGNLLYSTEVDHSSIPGSWNLAKRRYLERCVDLYGEELATAGNHTSLSLPEPLLAWDFMHMPASQRGDSRIDDYKNEVYVTGARLMRAFAALFVATSASTPFQARIRDGGPVVAITEFDSVRTLTFPNPPELDLPDLYRSYEDYIRISYDLVRRGVRFGNNNWTPTRARSLEEKVQAVIQVTSEQLQDLYSRGLYALGETRPPEEMAFQIEIENLLARIDIPMARVEIRTDDGNNPLALDIANLTLKYLLLLRFYADSQFARAFRYDREDINRARRNEEVASRHGMRAEIANPFTGKPVKMTDFLEWTLDQIRPLAEALALWEDLTPLVEMSAGGPNTAERLRAHVREMIGARDEVPLEVLQELAVERESQVTDDVETVASSLAYLGAEADKLRELILGLRAHVRHDPKAPIRFRPAGEKLVEMDYPDKTSEIVDLSMRLIRIPSVTVGAEERLDEVQRAATLIYDYLRDHGLEVRFFNQAKYPAILAGFPGQLHAPVMLSGHFDVVAPEPNGRQFEPRLEGDYLWGRGAADMKTVVATYLVWMKDAMRAGSPYPPINILLIGNEENGEAEPMGTPHILDLLSKEDDYAPGLFIAGERTEESGQKLWGKICAQNRGLIRFDVVARGQRGHSGVTSTQQDLSEYLLTAKSDLTEIMEGHLTLHSDHGWQSQAKFPFIRVGHPGIYNITADYGVLGVEVRPIPQDDVEAMVSDVAEYCRKAGLELENMLVESGVACDPDNPYLGALVEAVSTTSEQEAMLGRKLPGTSARFAPGGNGVVWGQSGIGPHSADERHFTPSILPYYQALNIFGETLIERQDD